MHRSKQVAVVAMAMSSQPYALNPESANLASLSGLGQVMAVAVTAAADHPDISWSYGSCTQARRS